MPSKLDPQQSQVSSLAQNDTVPIWASRSQTGVQIPLQTTEQSAVVADDSQLHLAARAGNLALCELLLQMGASASVVNLKGETPAQVAQSAGRFLVADFLASAPSFRVEQPATAPSTVSSSDIVAPYAETSASPDDLDLHVGELLQFEPEPQTWLVSPVGLAGGGAFVPLAEGAVRLEPENDWQLDLSSSHVTGDGISDDLVAPALPDDRAFLRTSRKGRRSRRRAVVQRGTRLSINREHCLTWATMITRARRCSSEDLDEIVSLCEGNGDPDDLRINLARAIEAAGLIVDADAGDEEAILWDLPTDISAVSLASSIEVVLTRQMRLPGARRFSVDKASEDRLVAPLSRAKLELQLGILACETAIGSVLAAMDKVLDGSWKADQVTLRAIGTPDRANPETSAVIAATSVLREWIAAGRVMDGKRRREALDALEELDLSSRFYAAVVGALAEHNALSSDAVGLQRLLASFETAVDRLILGHLPHVRRFASRHTEDGDDPDDVFQVAFMGLQRSTRRFSPERGQRFIHYATFWMMQTVERWRADECTLIRIPVHRREKIAGLDRALNQIDGANGRLPSGREVAAALEWPIEEAEKLMSIPRRSCETFDLMTIAAEDEYSRLDNEIDARAIADIVADHVAELPDRDADIIRRRFGIGHDEEMTLQEIADIYGVTRERIRQIEDRALGRLAHPGRLRSLRAACGR